MYALQFQKEDYDKHYNVDTAELKNWVVVMKVEVKDYKVDLKYTHTTLEEEKTQNLYLKEQLNLKDGDNYIMRMLQLW